MDEIKQSEDRLEVLRKREEYERNGWFDRDLENDPPVIPLKPEDVDYLNKKLSSKIKTFLSNIGGRIFFNGWMKNKLVVYKGVEGLENLKGLKTGAIVTTNHVHIFDNYAIYLSLKKHFKRLRLYKVIREGNYSFPGKVGFFLKNSDTLPLSQNNSTMKNCLTAVDTLLKRNKLVLVCPEQAMWWNYRKPRPYKNGAFRFAVKNNVPVIPCFVTLNDSDMIGPDGFPVQEFTVHIMPLIYPNPELPVKENIDIMSKQNFNLCKNKYEEVYGKKLEYLTK